VSALLVSLIFGLAIAAPFVCVLFFAQRACDRLEAAYEKRIYALGRELELTREQLLHRKRADEEEWEARVARFWAENDAASPDAKGGGAA